MPDRLGRALSRTKAPNVVRKVGRLTMRGDGLISSESDQNLDLTKAVLTAPELEILRAMIELWNEEADRQSLEAAKGARHR